eukprot:GHVU01173162.1.p3 GENE.GHVU01173162.1~~GHVU01173162.1.p3  ORF type:complete len:113 (+),score=11.75 GHVU01173162.1:411-749(+)
MKQESTGPENGGGGDAAAGMAGSMSGGGEVEKRSKPSTSSSKTLELLECPLCLETMGPPVFQCREGHTHCNECLAKVKHCPICRLDGVDIRCRALEQFAESLDEVMRRSSIN